MAKIDISKIDGYADMTPEQKIAALEAFETEDPDYSGYVKKDIFDKTASELAAKKKELNEKLTEDEQKKQKEQEEREELQSKYDKLLRESEVSRFKAKLLGMGYEEKLADATAEAMADGDTEKVFANQKKHLENARGKTVKWKNPLISNTTMANELAAWLADYYTAGIEYEYDTRGNPELDATDIVYQENEFHDGMRVNIYRHTVNFKQAFSGRVTARRIGG